jgi:hypothetical protein
MKWFIEAMKSRGYSTTQAVKAMKYFERKDK